MQKFIFLILVAVFVNQAPAAEYPPVTRGRMRSVDLITNDIYHYFGYRGPGHAILRLHRGRRGQRLDLFHADGVGVVAGGEAQFDKENASSARPRLRPSRLVASIVLHRTSRRSSVYLIGSITADRRYAAGLIFKTGHTINLAGDLNLGDPHATNILEIRAKSDDSVRRVRYTEAQDPRDAECPARLTEEGSRS